MPNFVAAIDFGTANSGVVWGPNGDRIVSSFQYVNRTHVNGYAKTRTSLLVKKSLMSRIDYVGDDFTIYGVDEAAEVDLYYGNDVMDVGRPNVINAHDEANWVLFEYFKMKLHNNSSAEPVVKGSDNCEYKLSHVIGLYLRCLKRATLKAINGNGGSSATHLCADDIKWGVTIPTIWGDRAKTTMGDAVRFGLNVDFISILEPEGAAASFATMMSPNHSPLTVGTGMRYMVIDCGGGTTDIVAQEVTEGGGYKEIRAADGKAAAGWDIDKNFYHLLAEKLAGSHLSKQDSFDRLIEDFKHDPTRFVDWVRLEKAWIDLKEQQLSANNDDGYMYPLELPRGYERWLTRNFSWANGLFEDSATVFFTQREIRDVVCRPIINQIIETARSVAVSCGHLDYVFLAGGLSGLQFLQKEVEAFVAKECRNSKRTTSKVIHEAQWADNHTLRGGTIMRGAAILLVYDKMIQRIAKRNYYYDCGLTIDSDAVRGGKEHLINRLLIEYDNPAIGLTDREKRDLASRFTRSLRNASVSDFDICDYENRKSILSYVPICLKDHAATAYKSDPLSSRGGGSKVNVSFYSSEKDLSFIVGASDPDVKAEGKVEIELPPGSTITIEVDFNEFQQEFFEAKIFKEGTLDKVVKIKPDFKIGH